MHYLHNYQHNMSIMQNLELLLNLPGITIDRIETTDIEIHIYCSSSFKDGVCSKCKEKTSRVLKYYTRTVRDLSISGRIVFLHLESRQFYCNKCDAHFMEHFCFVNPNQVFTERYKEYLFICCKGLDINRVSKNEGLGWDTVNDIFGQWAQKEIHTHDRMSRVTKLGIDEFSLKKGHKDFACVLVDLDDGAVIEVLKDRRKDQLIAYFEGLGDEFCNRIKVLSSDMWEGFTTLVGILFPNAELVIDRFHFFGHLNKALDSFRKETRKTVFKDTELHQGKLRFALLKPIEKQTIEGYDITQAAFDVSLDLKIFYTLKEELRSIFNLKISRHTALQKINQWIEQANIFDNKHLNKFLKTLNNWKDGVLNYFNERISNGVVEGNNNKIKMIKRRGFGYQNFENFRLRILTECAK